ncbi:MAG: 2-oxoacid ferredoxin oxidoreductase, partial [Edaphobacter sp.]
EYDTADWQRAMEKSLLWGDEIPIGVFFERNDVPTAHDAEPVLKPGPLVHQELGIPDDVAQIFIDELM